MRCEKESLPVERVESLVPSWLGLLPLYTEVAVNGNTAEGRKAATEELRRMAQAADAYNKLVDNDYDRRFEEGYL